MTHERGAIFVGNFERLQQLIANDMVLDKDKIGLNSTLIELGLDSMEAVELACSIETEFGIEIPDKFQMTGTLSQVVAMIEQS